MDIVFNPLKKETAKTNKPFISSSKSDVERILSVVIERQQWTSPPPVAYILSTSTGK